MYHLNVTKINIWTFSIKTYGLDPVHISMNLSGEILTRALPSRFLFFSFFSYGCRPSEENSVSTKCWTGVWVEVGFASWYLLTQSAVAFLINAEQVSFPAGHFSRYQTALHHTDIPCPVRPYTEELTVPLTKPQVMTTRSYSEQFSEKIL